MFRVTIVNSKGGSGKSTLATNLASYYAAKNLKTCLIDYDTQGSSSFWASRRPESLNKIEVISAYKQVMHVTRSWFLRPHHSIERVIIDSPSGLDVGQFKQTLSESDVIIVPVLPSSIDIHAVSHFIADLLLQGKIKRKEGRLIVVANRARKNTLVYQRLKLFLNSMGIPFITTLRDSQQYINACESGRGIFDIPRANPKDIESWQPLIQWLEKFESGQATPSLSRQQSIVNIDNFSK